jgi:hypothetical protein
MPQLITKDGPQLVIHRPRQNAERAGPRRKTMLWTITVILLILWLLGVVGVYTIGSWIHLLLILAIISIIFNLIAGRRAV